MTPETWAQAKEIYFSLAALPPTRRREELDRLSPTDEVRAAVGALLGHQSVPADFLEQPALGDSAREAVQAIAEGGSPDADPAIGMRVGPYRIDSRIGVGGMGAVYLASRADEQFEQRVAVKLVKRGLDTDEMLDRFRRERQLLAHLKHPNIAGLIDGGVAPDGRPFLVMEFVEGRPIDRYCQEQGLPVAARVRLFCQVCAAVHYAHQNLVVHRDLKPGNILVTGEGAPKLLDFGIAKVLAPANGQGPAVTAEERRLLTPGYASPEQVLGHPVSTASDVYSLGVVLYQLLTGEAPYSIGTGSDEEIRRVVCEIDPPPLATTARKTRSGAAPPSDNLPRQLTGDLDNIVRMALRKEPDRRYASAEQFAADLRRHLDGHPVLARRSTLGYRATKFVRRNRLGVAAAAAVGLATAAGVAGVAWQAEVARSERDNAVLAHEQAHQINEFLQSILQSANAFSREGHDVTVRELLEGSAERARARLADHPAVLGPALAAIGGAYTSLGVYDRAEPLLREALQISRDLGADDLPARLNDMATLLYATGALDEAETLLREALAVNQRRAGRESEGAALTLNNLGAVLRARGDLDGAETALREALALRRGRFGADDLSVAETLNNLANVLRLRPDLPGAEQVAGEALRIREAALGETHPLVAQSVSNLAVLVHSQGDLDRAEPLYQRSLALLTQALGPDHPDRASTLFGYGMLHRMRGQSEAAEPLLRESFEVRARVLEPAEPRVIRNQLELVKCLTDLGRYDEAIALAERARDALADAPEEVHRPAREALAAAYEAAGMPEKAAALR